MDLFRQCRQHPRRPQRYLTRKALGKELAEVESLTMDADTIVVPVPDTAKAAAASMAYELGVPCLEGLMRNRYVGRNVHRREESGRQGALQVHSASGGHAGETRPPG